MTPQISVELTSEARAILARTERFPEAMVQSVVRALDHQNEITAGEIMRLRLSRRGPDTLGVVTNRLRSSVWRTPARIGDNGRSIVSAIGTNVSYAGVHEFGFRGAVQVKEHSRRVFGTGRHLLTVTQERVKYLEKDGRIVEKRTTRKRRLASLVTVRAHTRDVEFPARAPFRRGIEAAIPDYRESLSKAIVGAWNGE